MKQKFTFLMAACIMLLTMMILPWKAVGQSTMTFDFEDSGAHTTTTNNYGTHTYLENGVNINTTYFDCIENNGIGGSYLARGRVAKKTTNSPVLEIGPITITGWEITSITYYTKGNTNISQTFATKTDTDEWTTQISAFSCPSSSTQKSKTLSISGKTSLFLKWTGTVSSANNNSNRDFDIDNIVITYTDNTSTYTITYAVSPLSTGSIAGKDSSNNDVNTGDEIAQSAEVTLTATANSGYKFSSWGVDGTGSTLSSTSTNPTTFTMGTANATVTANFVQTYSVACATGLANGSIEADKTSAAAGETVTITASPADNYKLKTVTVKETSGSNTVTPSVSGNTATFTMPAYGVTVSATFVRVYNVTYDANTTGYTGTTTDANNYEEGDKATVLSNGFSKEGYTFDHWDTQNDDAGTDYDPDDKITIGTSNVTLYAQWAIEKETVTIASVSGVTISAVYSDGTITSGLKYDCGTVIQLLADGLASGKGVVWDVYKTDDLATKVTVTDNSFEVPAYGVTISATVGDLFEKYTDDITAGDYVIYSSGAAMKNSISSNRFENQSSNISVSGNELLITNSTTAADVTWQAAKFGDTDYWTLYNADENKYAGSTSTKNTGALISPDDVDNYAKWTVEQPTNGEFNFVNLGRSGATDTPANKYLRKNGNNGWACYATGTGTKPSLYKKVASYRLDVLSVGHGDITANISGQSAIAEGANANVRPGATVTLVALPDTDYANDGWTVYKTSDESTKITVTDNQFTMPSYPVTVTTEFITAATVTLKYMVNGVATDVDVKEGSTVTLKTAEQITVPEGSTFNGWSTSATNFSTILTGSYTIPVGGATLYAVFSQTAPATFHFEITDADFVTSNYGDNNNEKTTTATATTGETMDVNWTSYQVMKSGGMQWKKSEGYIYNSTDLGTIISVVITSSEGSFTTYYGTSDQPTSGTTPGEGKGYFKTSVGSETGNTSSIVVTFVKNVPRKFSKVYGNESATGDIAINAPTLIPSGKVLNMGNHTLTVNSNYLTVADASCLIIGDGGQLICNNSVAATVKKSITASTASKGEGWYTISSPVNNKTAGGKNYETVAGVTNLVPATGKYDLYRFNETKDDSDENNKRWENYKVHGYDLEMGRGYIYRKNSSDELSFVGNTNVGNITYTLTCSNVPELAGFNLIGNPYPHSIAKGSGKAIQNGDYLATNYYVLSNNDTWDLCTDGSEIPSKQGILVQTVEGFNLTISDTPFTPVPGKYSNDNIRFSVANEQYEDVAYAWFDKGYGLNKIAHRNPDAPMLYIPQDGTNYATAIMSDDIKVFGLSFKAMTMGKYTLRTKANGDYTYLHVIDRLTGEDVDMLLDGEYSFVASPNDKENRFIVKLEYKPDYSEGNSDIFAYQSGSEILVSGEGELQIFDVTGRNVMTTTINGAEAINGLSNGVYIFRLDGNDIKTQKIVVR